MEERPILFSGPMVRAILEGRKTQTRRAIKPQPQSVDEETRRVVKYSASTEFLLQQMKCPYGKPGDRLWVRETWLLPKKDIEEYGEDIDPDFIRYKADGYIDYVPWRPAIHMPRWASRITLEITNVRVERLQDITEEDAKAEGVEPITESELCLDRYTSSFRSLWDSLNAKAQYQPTGKEWASNPWVWSIEFERIN